MEKGMTEGRTIYTDTDDRGDIPLSQAAEGRAAGDRIGKNRTAGGQKETDRTDGGQREPDRAAESLIFVADHLALGGLREDLRTYSPLALAFLGDAVYSLIIRTSVLAKGNRQAEKLHNETTRLVRAQKQAAIGRAIYDLMTPEEQKVYRRGRNSHPMHHARGASLEEYLQATALETLCGWLYLQGRTDRLMELLRTGMERTKRRNGDALL